MLREGAWINTGYTVESGKHQGVTVTAPLGTRHHSLSSSLCENDKHDLVTDEGFVCRCTSVSVLPLSSLQSLPDLSSSPRISISVLASPSIFSVCVNSVSPCLCHITQSTGCGCWSMLTREREMMPAPQAGIGLITKMDSHLILIPKSIWTNLPSAASHLMHYSSAFLASFYVMGWEKKAEWFIGKLDF